MMKIKYSKSTISGLQDSVPKMLAALSPHSFEYLPPNTNRSASAVALAIYIHVTAKYKAGRA